MGYTDYSLDHVMPEGIKELRQAVNQFTLWNRHEILLDGSISPQKQRIQLSQTPMSSPTDHALATPSSQQTHATPQLPSPHTDQEALQQPLQSSPKEKEASQQPLPSSPTPKVKEALQLPKRQKPQRTRKLHLYRLCPHLHHLFMTQSTRTYPSTKQRFIQIQRNSSLW
jgi:hypothetical protein